MVTRTQKKESVDTLAEVFNTSQTVIVTHYRGMSVSEMSELRQKTHESGATFRVTKNTLAKIAANDTPFEGVSDLFSGPTAIAASEDAVAAAKAVVEFAKDNEKLIIVGGAVDGTVLDEAGVKALASTPSLNESRAKLVGLLNAPASRLATVLQAPAGQVARVIGARSQKES